MSAEDGFKPPYPRISTDPALNSYNNRIDRFNSIEGELGTGFVPGMVFETHESGYVEDYGSGRKLDNEIDPNQELWVEAAKQALDSSLESGDTLKLIVWDYGSPPEQAELYQVELTDRLLQDVPSGMSGEDYYNGKLMITGQSSQNRTVDFSVTGIESELGSKEGLNLENWR